jgi:hypothetical protein
MVTAARARIPSGDAVDWNDLSPFQQLLFEASDLPPPVEFMALNWCQPGELHMLNDMIDTFSYSELQMLFFVCGLPVPRKQSEPKRYMRETLAATVRAYAVAHPTLFDDDAPEPTTPAAYKAHSSVAPTVAAAVIIPPGGPAAVVAAAPPRQRSAAAAIVQPSRAASVQALIVNELPNLRAPAASSIAQRRSTSFKASAAAAYSRAPQPRSFVPASAFAPPQRPPMQLSLLQQAAAVSSDSELDNEEEQDDVEDAVGGRFGFSSTERDGSLLSADDIAFALSQQGIPSAFTPGFLSNMRALDLYKDICKESAWDKQRHSKLEVQNLAHAIDAVLADNRALALEVLTRRLAAVQTGVETGNWDIGRSWDMPSQRTTFVPENRLIRAIKTTARNKAVENGAYGSGSSTTSRFGTKKPTSGGNRGGNGSRGTDRREEKSSSASGDRSLSSTKKSGSNKK